MVWLHSAPFPLRRQDSSDLCRPVTTKLQSVRDESAPFLHFFMLDSATCMCTPFGDRGPPPAFQHPRPVFFIHNIPFRLSYTLFTMCRTRIILFFSSFRRALYISYPAFLSGFPCPSSSPSSPSALNIGQHPLTNSDSSKSRSNLIVSRRELLDSAT